MPLAETAERLVSAVTLEDVRAMRDDFISAATAASVLRMDTSRLIGYAKEHPDWLPFPVVISGNRVKVPRVAFLKAYGVIEEEHEKDDQLDQVLKEIHNVNVALMATNMMLMGILEEVAPDMFQGIQEKIMEFAKGGLKQ